MCALVMSTEDFPPEHPFDDDCGCVFCVRLRGALEGLPMYPDEIEAIYSIWIPGERQISATSRPEPVERPTTLPRGH